MDVCFPITTASVSNNGHVVFKCTDSEILPSLDGAYCAHTGRQIYYAALKHTRGGLYVSGFIVKNSYEKKELDLRDEIFLLHGSLQFDLSIFTGTCQKLLGNGVLLWSKPFVARFSGENILIDISDYAQLQLFPIDIKFSQPMFSKRK